MVPRARKRKTDPKGRPLQQERVHRSSQSGGRGRTRLRGGDRYTDRKRKSELFGRGERQGGPKSKRSDSLKNKRRNLGADTPKKSKLPSAGSVSL